MGRIADDLPLRLARGMLWATFGILFWGDIPSLAVLIGGAMVASAGIYMLRRDARQRRDRNRTRA